MNQPQKIFCFCTLALGKKYRILSQQLAGDLAKFSPESVLAVGTDEPKEFSNYPKIIPFKHHKQGILHCYHDRRFVIEKALSMFPVAIHIDADTRILNNIPTEIVWLPGITARQKNLIEHVSKFSAERLPYLRKVASKLNIPIENTNWIGESLYVVTRDGGREKEFIRCWGMIGKYLEMNGIHAGDGNAMGLAAAKVGWTVNSDGWEKLKNVTQHLDASYGDSNLTPQVQITFWDKLKSRLDYHYRLNRVRLMALKDFDFYYR